jgi:RNA polymerase sigma factor (TIGR02999 family)
MTSVSTRYTSAAPIGLLAPEVFVTPNVRHAGEHLGERLAARALQGGLEDLAVLLLGTPVALGAASSTGSSTRAWSFCPEAPRGAIHDMSRREVVTFPGLHPAPASATHDRVSDAPELTDLIRRVQGGDSQAFAALFEIAYEDLRELARARLRQRQRGTLLDTTALLHESYLRFTRAGRLRLEDRAHFLAYAAHVMRSVIVDFARQRLRQRRGGDLQRVALTDRNLAGASGGEIEVLSLHEALDGLAQHDPRLVQVVEMRYFGGLSDQEIAEALGVTDRTVRRDWEKARLLLAEVLL